jgi:hypothetical protein
VTGTVGEKPPSPLLILLLPTDMERLLFIEDMMKG